MAESKEEVGYDQQKQMSNTCAIHNTSPRKTEATIVNFNRRIKISSIERPVFEIRVKINTMSIQFEDTSIIVSKENFDKFYKLYNFISI